MSSSPLSPRVAGWRLAAVTGLLAASTLVPLAAHAEDPLPKCDGKTKMISSGVQLCFKEGETERVWVKPAKGSGYSMMASACCTDPAVAERWIRIQKNPNADSWYPLEAASLKPDLLKKLPPKPSPLPHAAEGAGGRSPEHGDSSRAPSGTEPGPTATERQASLGTEAGRDSGHPKSSENPSPDGLLFVTCVLGLLFVAACSIALLALFKARDLEERLDDLRFPQNREAAEGTAPLPEPLAQAPRQALQQRITVELTPPSAVRLADWDPFLLRLREVLGTSAPADGPRPRVAGPEEKKQRPDPLPGFGPAYGTATAVPRTSGERRYVQRETTYGAAAKNFGGEFAFQETPNQRATFYVDLADQESGWLYPNPSAGEPDPLLQSLFGLGFNDFPLKVNVNPKAVRRDGQRWVLAS